MILISFRIVSTQITTRILLKAKNINSTFQYITRLNDFIIVLSKITPPNYKTKTFFDLNSPIKRDVAIKKIVKSFSGRII